MDNEERSQTGGRAGSRALQGRPFRKRGLLRSLPCWPRWGLVCRRAGVGPPPPVSQASARRLPPRNREPLSPLETMAPPPRNTEPPSPMSIACALTAYRTSPTRPATARSTSTSHTVERSGSPASSGIDRMSPQYISADQTCRHLLPGGVPTPAQNQQALAQELKFAQCMRSHGVPNYPDPNPSDPGVVRLIGVDQNSPQFLSAQKVCQALVPGSDSK